MSVMLRPIERRILKMHDDGLTQDEIAARFRRSPGHIGRILSLAALPGRTGARSDRGGLRALERRVLRLRSEGLSHEEIAGRFRRTEGHIRRVEGMALYKKALRLLADEA